METKNKKSDGDIMVVNIPKNISSSLNRFLWAIEKYYSLKLLSGDVVTVCYDGLIVDSQDLPLKGEEYREKFGIVGDIGDFIEELLEFGSYHGIGYFRVLIPDRSAGSSRFWRCDTRDDFGILMLDVGTDNSSPEEDLGLSMMRLPTYGRCKVPDEVIKYVISNFNTILSLLHYDKSNGIRCGIINDGKSIFLDWENCKSEDQVSIMYTDGDVSVLRDEEPQSIGNDSMNCIINFSDYILDVLKGISKITISFGGFNWDRNECFSNAYIEKGSGGTVMYL